jgi:hypothetical protein
MADIIGWATREQALKMSRSARVQPAVKELSDGSFAAVLEDTIDNDGCISSWLLLPGRSGGVVRLSEIRNRGLLA